MLLCEILLISLVSLFLSFQTFLLLGELQSLFHCQEIATAAVASVFTAVVAAADSTPTKTMPKTANIAGFAISDVSDVSVVSAPISTATAFSLLRNRYCFWCQVFTVVIAATDSTTAETISNTANVAAFAIFDVSAAINIDTPFSLLRNRYCSCCLCFHRCTRCDSFY